MAGSGFAYEVRDDFVHEFVARTLKEEPQLDPELVANFDVTQAQWEVANREGDPRAHELLDELRTIGRAFPVEDWHNPDSSMYLVK